MELKRFFINLAVLSASLLFSFLVLLLTLKSIEIALGANLKGCEFQRKPSVWVEDPVIGFRNKPNYAHKGFANLRAKTDSFGFRSKRTVALKKNPGVIRVIGIGDSVMWGNQLNEENTFLHVFGKLAGEKKRLKVETINAGVVGYSTYQEKLFFEKYVLLLKPDIVLVNFCANDWLPTEDPFHNLKDIYLQYLKSIPKNPDYQVTENERLAIDELIQAMKADKTWDLFRILGSSPEKKRIFQKVLIEWPILQMSKLAKDNSIRLIYIFLTPELVEMRGFLAQNSIEFLDVTEALYKNDLKTRKEKFPEDWNYPFIPVKIMSNIKGAINFNSRQHKRTFIDGAGHPSIKGSKIIAEHLYKYLWETTP